MEAVAAQPITELSCVLIPTEDMVLLLPNDCVAEILPWRRIRTLNDVPDWCLGMLEWRGESIPVVRFERLNKSSVGDRKLGRCLVVMNRTQASGSVAFYALAAEGLPRIVQLTSDDITSVPTQLGIAEAASLRVGAERAVIPNLQLLEQEVAELMRGEAPAGPAETGPGDD